MRRKNKRAVPDVAMSLHLDLQITQETPDLPVCTSQFADVAAQRSCLRFPPVTARPSRPARHEPFGMAMRGSNDWKNSESSAGMEANPKSSKLVHCVITVRLNANANPSRSDPGLKTEWLSLARTQIWTTARGCLTGSDSRHQAKQGLADKSVTFRRGDFAAFNL